MYSIKYKKCLTKCFILSLLNMPFGAFGQVTKVFPSTHDATIKSSSASSNYGRSSEIEVDSNIEALLKFSVSEISGSIISAKVRLYVTNGSKDGPKVYLTDANWIETTVTYSTRPAILSQVLFDVSAVSSSKYVDIDVSSAVKENGVFSFILRPDSSDGMDSGSRDSSYATKRPSLIIVTSSETTTPTEPVTPITPTEPTTPTAPTTYNDDTQSILLNGVTVLKLSGNYNYSPVSHSVSADGKALAIDMREATFIVANSKNSFPTLTNDCNNGSLPTNLYPIQIRGGADYVGLAGVFMTGLVPQETEWRPTYCNSAAITFRESAINGTVDGVRITSSWDAIRQGEGSDNLTVKNSWLSGVRDDFVENDYRSNLNFIDNLVDGSFQGISIRPSSSSSVPDASSKVIKVSGSVIRIRSHNYSGNLEFGALFKTTSSGAPKSSVHNTVLAVDPGSGASLSSTNWLNTWKDMSACGNNLFLWMSDRTIPSDVGTIPSCFTVIKGQAAVDLFNKAKKNWIDCHPKVRRSINDPASDFSQCRANEFGGYTN